MAYPTFSLNGIHHVQIAIPVGTEPEARRFYGGALNLVEVPVPKSAEYQGSLLFRRGFLRLYLRPSKDFRPAKIAHPAFVVERLDLLAAELEAGGIALVHPPAVPGVSRVYVSDPFGNRLELIGVPVSQELG